MIALAIVSVVSVLGVIGYLSCCYTPALVHPPDGPPITAGVEISHTVDNQTADITVTVSWETRGSAKKLTVFTDDDRVTLDRVGKKVSLSGLSEDERIKIVGTVETGRTGVIQIYTAG